jgi:O-methyltransferase involved in polyketide biosynthesis
MPGSTRTILKLVTYLKAGKVEETFALLKKKKKAFSRQLTTQYFHKVYLQKKKKNQTNKQKKKTKQTNKQKKKKKKTKKKKKKTKKHQTLIFFLQLFTPMDSKTENKCIGVCHRDT